jgi:hypothetical protein
MTDNAWNLYQYNSTLSVDSFENNISVDIYPNPVKNELFINTQLNLKSVEIYDVTGKQILRLDDIENDKSINLSSLKKGIYLVKLKTPSGDFQTKKIIKQ